MKKNIEEKLKLIYKEEYQGIYLENMMTMLNEFIPKSDVQTPDHKSVYLITYGDIIKNANEPTLNVLHRFVKKNFGSNITDIHLLPMFEYTSDDGFSVLDYMKINPILGDWNEIKLLSEDYGLMFDFVANHISKSSQWFNSYLNNEPTHHEFFISEDKTFDYSRVIRPRTTPLISNYDNNKTAWTTFSEDQVDLNYRNIEVLIETTRILLEYVKRGATAIRLDAIGFLWKSSGTTCIHLPETHQIVKMWRLIFDELAPNVQIITETNVPHHENISYFGENDEANQVYQFALPPLVLHTFINKNSEKLSRWAKTIDKVSDNATYFNFLASHDGIGMRPAEGILDDTEIQNILNHMSSNGAKFNMKANNDGSESVYEVNTTFFDAIKNDKLSEDLNINRFMSAHGILFSLIGVPAIYYHSLLGSENYYEGVSSTGINRRINRKKFTEQELSDLIYTSGRSEKVMNNMNNIISIRSSEQLFNPYNRQEILDFGTSFFVVKRYDNEGNSIVCIFNITSDAQTIEYDGFDIITNTNFSGELQPYQFVWLK